MSCFLLIMEFLKAAASYAWPVAVFVIFLNFKEPISRVFASIAFQVRQGASLKYGSIELVGKSIENFVKNSPMQGENNVYDIIAADSEILNNRNNIYNKQKNIFLVHRVSKTDIIHKETNLNYFEISIYLIPHKNYGALNDVKYVEYYLGKHFKKEISEFGAKFVVRNSNDGFAIKTRAYGPSLCEARVHFHDGTIAILNRYLDFEVAGYRYDPETASFDVRKQT